VIGWVEMQPYTIQCTNCSEFGHTSKACPNPITSYGVLLFRIRDVSWNPLEIFRTPDKQRINGFEGLYPEKLEYLLIQRRDSMGFVEIMRGKYKLTDIPYIRQLLAGITEAERKSLLERPFDELWEKLWGPPQEGTHAYRNEKDASRMKLEALLTGTPSLRQLLEEAPPAPATPEWGFPKGRKELNEREFTCAMREMWEETNISESQIMPTRGLEPLTEEFIGSNSVRYCHKYYVAYVPPGVGEEGYEAAAAANPHIRREVGDIRWCSLKEALALLRVEPKKDILLRAHSLFKWYCPLRLASAVRWRSRG
jgi:8-oxo-dGTP pyrophosphatase MutT (NUDIX family)